MDKENSIPCGLTIRCFEFNMIGENCYVVSDETRDCVIIDCGAYWKDEREELVEYITKNELRPVRLLATHGHLDHHFGDNTLYDTYGLSPELSEEDEYVYKSLLYQAEKYFHLKLNYKFPAPGSYLQDGETISFGNHELLVLPTPGHTPGSVSFYCKSEGFLFTGALPRQRRPHRPRRRQHVPAHQQSARTGPVALRDRGASGPWRADHHRL